jgi:hypothetical protein
MLKLVAFVALFLFGANAHMSIYVPSMWGSEPTNQNSNWAVNPLEDLSFNDWWWHGGKSVNDPPPANAITQIPAGGTIDFEIGTNKAFTTMGRGLWHSPGKTSRVPPDPWANTGSEWPSNLHSPKRSDVAGCALGIAYKSNMRDINPEDFVIFSVAKDCPARALQAFDVPYLPACPDGKCHCAWFWIHNSIGGTDQMYMTAFQCNVANPSKRVIGKPVPPVRCDGQPSCYLYPNWGNKTTTCKKPLQPMYWGNTERMNMFNPTNAQCAPIYSAEYGYPDGAQHQIFVDDFKCIQGSIGDTLFSTSNHSQPSTISSSPASVLATPSCMTRLTVQGDGNVVFADVNTGKVYWATNTAGKGTGPYRFTIQNDGNLVLYDSKSTALWTSGTAGKGCAPYHLKVRDVNQLTVVDCNSEPLWSISN